MISQQSLPFMWFVVVPMEKVYKRWDRHASDAAHDVDAFIHSVLAVGIKPYKIEVEWNWQVLFYFERAGDAEECEHALTRVLDLIWLVD